MSGSSEKAKREETLELLMNRVGIFSITLADIKENPKGVRDLLSQCIITRCEHIYGRNMFIYEAMSMSFIPLPTVNAQPTPYSIDKNSQGTLRFLQSDFLKKLGGN